MTSPRAGHLSRVVGTGVDPVTFRFSGFGIGPGHTGCFMEVCGEYAIYGAKRREKSSLSDL
jgi:hypothetical protein